MSSPASDVSGLRGAVRFAALANASYFGIEFAVALAIGSTALAADSVDFLEDAAVNVLILIGLGWGVRARARLGFVLAAILLAPALAFVWTLWRKLDAPVPPDPAPLALAALGALFVNATCAFVLARHRTSGGSLARAAFLSARNDVAANLAIIAAGLVTAFVWRSIWPDVIVGCAIAALNIGAAREVLEAARGEHDAAS